MVKEKVDRKILVLGLGNEVLMDDGIGPKLVNDLKLQTANLKPQTANFSLHFENIFKGGLDILEFIQGYDTVIFIDAIKTKNGIPGDVYYCTPADFRETSHLSSQHDASFLTALKFGKKLGFVIPEKIHIIAIEIIEDRTFGSEFTEPLQKRYEEILNKVKEMVNDLLKS